jgi:glutathione S-transferase
MSLTLYDLSGLAGRRFSPFGWRARMALAHKGLHDGCDVVLVSFTEKDKLAFSGQQLVPVLVDGDTVVPDSWAIAVHLEGAYPDAPSLFGPAGPAPSRLVASWVDTQVHPKLAPLIVGDILDVIEEKDVAYFRETREKRFGQSMESIRAARDDAKLGAFRHVLEPARRVLAEHPFLGGDTPTAADYALFGAFMWARGVSPFRLLEESDPVHAWRERLLDGAGGMPRTEPGFPV